MDKDPLRHLVSDPSMILYLAKYWPGLVAVVGLLLAGYSFLSSYGFIDGVVHMSQFSVFKTQLEAHEKFDTANHAEVKAVVSEIRNDTKQLLQEQIKLGRAVERMEAHANSTPKP